MNANKGRPMPYREPRHTLHPTAYALRKRRYEIGITAEQLAERLGCALKTVQDWECGDHVPPFLTLHKWAGALGMTIDFVETK